MSKKNGASGDPYKGMGEQVDAIFGDPFKKEAGIAATADLISDSNHIVSAADAVFANSRGELPSAFLSIFNPARDEVFNLLSKYQREPQIMVDEQGRPTRLRRVYTTFPNRGNLDSKDLPLVFVDNVTDSQKGNFLEIDMSAVGRGKYAILGGHFRRIGKDGKFKRLLPISYARLSSQLQGLYPLYRFQTRD